MMTSGAGRPDETAGRAAGEPILAATGLDQDASRACARSTG